MITLIVIVIGSCVTRFRVPTIAAARAASVIIETQGNFPTVVTVSHEHHNTLEVKFGEVVRVRIVEIHAPNVVGIEVVDNVPTVAAAIAVDTFSNTIEIDITRIRSDIICLSRIVSLDHNVFRSDVSTA